jgi:hypothetical protein
MKEVLLAGIPLQRVNCFYSMTKKMQMKLEALEEEKARRDSAEPSVE